MKKLRKGNKQVECKRCHKRQWVGSDKRLVNICCAYRTKQKSTTGTRYSRCCGDFKLVKGKQKG